MRVHQWCAVYRHEKKYCGIRATVYYFDNDIYMSLYFLQRPLNLTYLFLANCEKKHEVYVWMHSIKWHLCYNAFYDYLVTFKQQVPAWPRKPMIICWLNFTTERAGSSSTPQSPLINKPVLTTFCSVGPALRVSLLWGHCAAKRSIIHRAAERESLREAQDAARKWPHRRHRETKWIIWNSHVSRRDV